MTWFADLPVDVLVVQGTPFDGARVDIHARGVGGGRGARIRVDDDGPGGRVASRELAVGGQVVELAGRTSRVADVYLPLHGAHQADNAAAVLEIVDALTGGERPDGVDAQVVRDAFARLRLPGRLEVVRRADAATVVLDAAQDPGDASALGHALAEEFAVRHRIGVLGLRHDDPVAVLRALGPVLDHAVVTPAPVGDATPVDAVVTAARALGLPVEVADTVDAALASASGLATAEDVVVVTGGPQTVGSARHVLGLQPVEDLLAVRDS